MSSTRVLAAMTGFIGAGGAIGATVIVPSLPIALYRPDVVSNDLVPAIGLGIVAAISIGATYALLTRRRIGPYLGIAAGLSLIEFKLVEALAVGNILSRPVAIGVAGYALVWLQPTFIALGVAMIALAVRTRRAAT